LISAASVEANIIDEDGGKTREVRFGGRSVEFVPGRGLFAFLRIEVLYDCFGS
jgi:hypothetical protein